MTRAADDPIVRAEIHDTLTACGLDPVTEGAIDGVIAIAGAGTYSYSDAAQVATEAINRHRLKEPSTRDEATTPLAEAADPVAHFAPWGSVVTSCGEAVPRTRSGVTTRRTKTTCPRCRSRFTNPADAPADTALDGATTPGEPNTWPANAGDYAARWNAHDTQWREEHVTGQVDIAQRASRCIEHDHEGKIRYLEQGWNNSTAAWHQVNQHPKVAALSHLPIPLYEQVLQALDQPYEDTEEPRALAEGSAYGSVEELVAAGREFRGQSDQFAELITELADALAAQEALTAGRVPRKTWLEAARMLRKQNHEAVDFHERSATAIFAERARSDEAVKKAWDRGYGAGHSVAMRRMSDEPDARTALNPYRVAADIGQEAERG